jgi:hypothetical protein
MRKNMAEKNYSVSQFNRVCWFCQRPIKKGQKYVVKTIKDWDGNVVVVMYYHPECYEKLCKMGLNYYDGTTS